MPAPSDAPVVITLSDTERLTGALTDTHLFDAVDSIHRDGVVVVENAISHETIDFLNERMCEDTERILNSSKKDLVHWK